MGSREKFWLKRADGEFFLCKMVRELDDRPFGEDWAEWLVSLIGPLLGLPTVSIQPVEFNLGGRIRRGVISRNFVGTAQQLVHGNQLLTGLIPGYGGQGRFEPGYAVDSVVQVLKSVDLPKDCHIAHLENGFDAWAGYVVMDALVAGVDRHHENWGVIRTVSDLRLAPSFDHGNSLGVYESNRRIQYFLRQDQVVDWVARGRSRFWGQPSLLEVARQALHQIRPIARYGILEKVQELDTILIRRMMDTIPDSIMTEDRKLFALEIMRINRERILNGC